MTARDFEMAARDDLEEIVSTPHRMFVEPAYARTFCFRTHMHYQSTTTATPH